MLLFAVASRLAAAWDHSPAAVPLPAGLGAQRRGENHASTQPSQQQSWQEGPGGPSG